MLLRPNTVRTLLRVSTTVLPAVSVTVTSATLFVAVRFVTSTFATVPME